MTTTYAIEILDNHNKWRRGWDIEPTDSATLGVAIDTVLAELRRYRDNDGVHVCKYCGAETNQPDEECYKAPDSPLIPLDVSDHLPPASHVFDRDILMHMISLMQPGDLRHFIGTDTSEPNNLSYCLGRSFRGADTVLLLKTMADRQAFDSEVLNLAKYFDATIFSGLSMQNGQ